MPRDTSADAEKVQLEIQRRMTGAQRLKLALRMSDMFRKQAASRIRKQHAEFSEQQAKDQLLFELYGFRRNS